MKHLALLAILISVHVATVHFFIDINECAESIDNCAQICTDTDGSYTCSCEAGYDLASNGHGCNGENNNLFFSIP